MSSRHDHKSAWSRRASWHRRAVDRQRRDALLVLPLRPEGAEHLSDEKLELVTRDALTGTAIVGARRDGDLDAVPQNACGGESSSPSPYRRK
ncbi:MAG: nitrile hydratase subunit alpha [Actinomycetota bacterium]|nr:nitrile hydratase subunit alpha [Actinomycetota bacterium]